MNNTMRAVEVTGSIDEHGHLHLDQPLTLIGPSRVRILLLTEEGSITESEWLRAASRNAAFDFLKDPAEDIYTIADGEPFRDEG